MRKYFTLAIIASIFIVSTVSAQSSFGIKAGVNASSWKGETMSTLSDVAELTDGYVTTSGRTGFYAGGFANIPLNERFSVEPGVYYSQKGYTVRGELNIDKLGFLGASARAQVQSHYIDVPVLLKATVADGFQVFAGPQVSFLAKNNLNVRAGALGFSVINRNMDISEQFNTVDVSLVGGLGYEFSNGFSINAAYDHGLSRLDQNSNLNSYNRTVKVGVGFRF